MLPGARRWGLSQREDATLLALKTVDGAVSEGMRAASRSRKSKEPILPRASGGPALRTWSRLPASRPQRTRERCFQPTSVVIRYNSHGKLMRGSPLLLPLPVGQHCPLPIPGFSRPPGFRPAAHRFPSPWPWAGARVLGRKVRTRVCHGTDHERWCVRSPHPSEGGGEAGEPISGGRGARRESSTCHKLALMVPVRKGICHLLGGRCAHSSV